MRKIKWLQLLAILTILVMVVSCGPEATDTPEPEPTEEPTEEVVETEEAEMEETEEAEMEETEEAEMEETEEAAEVDEAAWGTITVAADETLTLGFAAALTGQGVDVLGIDEQRGAELAVEDLNAEDGILGFTVELDSQDSLCSAEGGATVANKFASDEGVVAIVGHMCSSACEAAKEIYADVGYSMVSPSCTAITLTDPNSPSPVFNRTAWNDRVQAPAAAEFLYNEQGVESIATIHDGSPYGEGLVNAMADAFIDLGGEVIEELAVNVGDTDMRSVLEQIASAGPPDAIYFGGFPAEGAFLAQQRADVGMEDVLFMGADGIYATAYVEAAGEAGCGTFASAANPAEVEGGGYDAFVERYAETYGEEPTAPFHAHTYDAVMLIAKAIEEVGEVDDEGNLTIDRVALRDAIRATEEMEGLTGTISCNEYGDCGSGADITVVEMMCPEDADADWAQVWPALPEEEEAEPAAETEEEMEEGGEEEATEETMEEGGEAEATEEATEEAEADG